MSIWTDGIPDRFLTPVWAVALGLFIGGAYMIYNEIEATVRYYATEPKTAPICYLTKSRKHEPGTKRIPARGARDRSGRSIDDPPKNYDIDKMFLAARACTPDSCDSDARWAYDSALFWYVSARKRHTAGLDRVYGDAGLERARAIYRTPKDRQIEQGMRDLYNADILRINDFKQNREAIAILIMRGGEAFRPCRWNEQPYPE